MEKLPVTMIITWSIWAVKGQRLVVIDHWPALICSAVWNSGALKTFFPTQKKMTYFVSRFAVIKTLNSKTELWNNWYTNPTFYVFLFFLFFFLHIHSKKRSYLAKANYINQKNSEEQKNKMLLCNFNHFCDNMFCTSNFWLIVF